ncbi:MAG: alpha/beta fold hydrolase [Clostridia bacterium]|nr:alpha/beta fold hydrolase [Clostridia bacterium]
MIFSKQIEKLYRAQLFGRCDDVGNARYFSAEDFEGLMKEPFSFVSARGERLHGYFYSYEGYTEGRLIVFDHGYGGGHRSYMKEIEMLCRHGFRVFAYDHTGCMESEGKSTCGFAQSLSDLNDALNALKADEGCKNNTFSVVGHSWGAFSCLNITALHPDIAHVVAISGFISVEAMINQNFSGIMKGYRKHILKIEQDTNPKFVGYNAIDTLSKTDAEVLLIYSSSDKLVKKEHHFDLLEKGLAGKKNIRLILTENKGHNPNYTEDAVKYLGEFSTDIASKKKAKKLETSEQKSAFVASYDWNRMTAQDEKVWSEIFSTLDK